MRSEFIVEKNGKQFVLYQGLLDEAHSQGLKEIRTVLLQIPTQENGNVAIVQTTVTTEKGIFSGLGDASPQNVARAMLPCLIRMAETRSKARALRDAVNIGVCSMEELMDGATGEEEAGARDPLTPSATPPAPVVPAGHLPPVRQFPPARGSGSSDPMTTAQRCMLQSLARQKGQGIQVEGLSRKEASQLITRLKSMAA